MRVLIRTLPLGYGNYGGILQAWALQKALETMGHLPITDVSERPKSVARSVLKRAALFARSPLPSSWRVIPGDTRRHQDEPLLEFVRSEIRTTRVFGSLSRTARQSVLQNVDAFVTGSDQVWRAAYADVPSYLFDFLPARDRSVRVSYAASMGSVAQNKWDANEISKIGTLLDGMRAISVRETDAAEWIEEQFGLRAVVAPDPTLLIDVERYRSLANTVATSPHNGGRYLLAYVLDTSPELRHSIELVAEQRGLPIVDMERSGRRRTVQEWLALIQRAELVVTDSFHGTVFSALFNTPFLTLVNQERGAERFATLATLLGVEERLAHTVGGIADPRPDAWAWSDINRRIEVARNDGMDFLGAAIV